MTIINHHFWVDFKAHNVNSLIANKRFLDPTIFFLHQYFHFQPAYVKMAPNIYITPRSDHIHIYDFQWQNHIEDGPFSLLPMAKSFSLFWSVILVSKGVSVIWTINAFHNHVYPSCQQKRLEDRSLLCTSDDWILCLDSWQLWESY